MPRLPPCAELIHIIFILLETGDQTGKPEHKRAQLSLDSARSEQGRTVQWRGPEMVALAGAICQLETESAHISN